MPRLTSVLQKEGAAVRPQDTAQALQEPHPLATIQVVEEEAAENCLAGCRPKGQVEHVTLQEPGGKLELADARLCLRQHRRGPVHPDDTHIGSLRQHRRPAAGATADVANGGPRRQILYEAAHRGCQTGQGIKPLLVTGSLRIRTPPLVPLVVFPGPGLVVIGHLRIQGGIRRGGRGHSGMPVHAAGRCRRPLQPYPIGQGKLVVAMVQPAITHPLTATLHGDQPECEALGNRPTAQVVRCRPQSHPVNRQGGKRVAQKHTAGPGHQPTALPAVSQPVAEIDDARRPVEPVVADHPGQHPPRAQPEMQALAVARLRLGRANERGAVGRGTDGVHPRQPLAQAGARTVRQGKQLTGVRCFQGAQLPLRVEAEVRPRHGTRPRFRAAAATTRTSIRGGTRQRLHQPPLRPLGPFDTGATAAQDTILKRYWIGARTVTEGGAMGLCLLLLSGDAAKLHAAATMTLVAASYGQEVRVYVSMEALAGFHRRPEVRAQIRCGPIATRVAAKGADYLEILRQARDAGGVRVYACALVLDVEGWTLEDLEPVFDDSLGVAGFVAETEGQSIVTF